MTRRSDESGFFPALALRAAAALWLFASCSQRVIAQDMQTLEAPGARLSMKLDAGGFPADNSGVRAADWTENGQTASRRKSPLLAGALSLALPGAGEIYAGSYVPAAVFLAAEAVGWYYRLDYLGRGDDQTALFESYADDNWSVVKYAEWLNENAAGFPGGENAPKIDILPDAGNIYRPWERVNWEQLNAVEMSIAPFSHRLPMRGDQQYYELIGKYDQYSYGWADKSGGYYREISPMFRLYSGMRGKANDFYNTASTVLNLILLNHFLSAVDAAWAAARFNSVATFESHVRIRTLPTGERHLEPTATFRVGF